MVCKNCGSEVKDTEKFCGYCGTKVEVPEVKETERKVEELESLLHNSINDFNGGRETLKENGLNIVNEANVISNSQNELNMINEERSATNVQNDLNPVNNEVSTNNQSNLEAPNTEKVKSKKNNAPLVLIIIGIVLIVAAGIIYYSFSKNKSASIDNLVTYFANFEGKENGKVKANMALTLNGASYDLSGEIAFAKKSDNYNVSVKINKFLLFDEFNIYAKSSDKEVIVYLPSSAIDLLGATASDEDIWTYFSYPIEEELEKEVEEVQDNDYKLSDIIDSKHYKLVGTKNGLRHFALTIDNDVYQSIKSKLTDEEQEELDESFDTFLENDKLKNPIIIDFFINKNDEIEKISMDLTKLIGMDTITNCVFSITFEDFGNTKVEIPSDVLKSTMDLATYTSTYSTLKDSLDIDYDFDTNYDFDTSLDANF